MTVASDSPWQVPADSSRVSLSSTHARIEFIARRDEEEVRRDRRRLVPHRATGVRLGGRAERLRQVQPDARRGGIIPLARGSISVSGNKVTGPEHDRAMVFQSASLLPWRTVLGNVVYGLEIMKTDRASTRARAKEMIDLVGLHGFSRTTRTSLRWYAAARLLASASPRTRRCC